ncbi:hypothetical protein [Caulobacter sp. S45]|uniref:hypothetical protein n=1 Tax=Caulobacter sp. S45 TaxID=1641861 RepID=UPI00157672FE|nr:hypothetical protein [Caulobacter sp. S45]
MPMPPQHQRPCRIPAILPRWFAWFAFMALAGCAQPPAYVAVNHQRLVPLTAADVWRRLHLFLQDQGITVVSEDAAAGTIDARQAVSGKGLLVSYADCGGGFDLMHTLQSQTLNLTILVKPASDGAQVTANAAFSQTLRARRAGALTVACHSNGVLESAVLNVASGQPMEAAVIPQ